MVRQFIRTAAQVLSLVAFASNFGYAGNLDVLWFTAGTGDGGSFVSYEEGVRNLASQASQLPGANTWNVTFWNAGFDPASTSMSSYNVLVVASPQFIDGADYSSLNASFPALGSRVIVTGMDADWHYMNYPGTTDFDGPAGFLQNAVNWAGSGTGMGAVFLAPQGNVSTGLSGLGNEVSYDNMDNIQVGDANHAINSGLSSTGLSNWATSGKEAWDSFDTSAWSVIHVNGDDATRAVTLASVQTNVPPDPGSEAPEVSTGPLLAGAAACLLLLRRRK